MSVCRFNLVGVALLAVVVAAGTAKATKADLRVTGNQIFGEIGEPLANGSPTGNINTATTFTVDELVPTRNQSGVFVGLPSGAGQAGAIPPFTFNPSNPTSIHFGGSLFGHFASTSITEVENVPTTATFDVVGEWTPGAFPGFNHIGHRPFQAAFTLGFTQPVAHTGIIPLSASLAVAPATVIPEPPSIVLVLTGLAAGSRNLRVPPESGQLVMA